MIVDSAVGGRNDGAFSLDGTDCFLEAKWEKHKIERADQDEFVSKVGRKLDNTLGLFLSMSGFQYTALSKHSDRRFTIILMEGPDLMAVLEQRIDFAEMLRRKRRHATETGQIFFPLYPILLQESNRGSPTSVARTRRRRPGKRLHRPEGGPRSAPGCCLIAVKRPGGAPGGGQEAPQPRGIAGADGRTRTADLLITNQLLYQLSYVGSAPVGGLRRGRS